MTYVVVDTETTGLDIHACDIIEIAAAKVGTETVNEILINPGVPIPEEVVKITNITDSMVESQPNLLTAMPEILAMLHIDENPIFVAHNAAFDRKVILNNFVRAGFAEADLPFLSQDRWLCTHRLSRKAYGDIPRLKSTRLSEMKSFLKLEVPDSNIAHRAGNDVLTCMKLFEYVIQDKYSDLSSNELVSFCWDRLIYSRFPFGKYKGRKIQDIPTSYFVWMCNNIESLNPTNENFDADLYVTIDNEIDRRMLALK